MSPVPGRSTLITSAPNQARSCVQVGPDCTCVKSRMRTPSRAFPAWPNGFDDGLGRLLDLPLPFDFFAAGFFTLASLIGLRPDFLAAAFAFGCFAFCFFLAMYLLRYPCLS